MLYALMMVAESPITMHIYFRYSYTDLAVTLARVISLQNDISRIICCANYHIFSFSATPFVCSIVTRFQVSQMNEQYIHFFMFIFAMFAYMNATTCSLLLKLGCALFTRWSSCTRFLSYVAPLQRSIGRSLNYHMQRYSNPSNPINVASGRHLKIFLHRLCHWLKLCLQLIQLSVKLRQLHCTVMYARILSLVFS